MPQTQHNRESQTRRLSPDGRFRPFASTLRRAPGPQGYGGNGHIASANSPLPGLMESLREFENAGVPADRVVVGIPWYGYDYHCDSGADANKTGAICNATVGSKQGAPQIAYSRAVKLLNASTTGLMFNSTTVSAWFDYTCTNTSATTGCKGLGRHQVHFDTNHTLTLKQQALRAAGARGVAWWNTGSVDYGTADHQAEIMWDAMSAFAGPRAAPAPLPPV